jgi:putative transcriptional regulator
LVCFDSKSNQGISKVRKGVLMRTEKDWDALIQQSVAQGIAYVHGENIPARVTKIEAVENALQTRHQLGISRPKFAKMIGVSVRTLENWEQGRSQPNGAARALLRVAAYAPDVVLKALSSSG